MTIMPRVQSILKECFEHEVQVLEKTYVRREIKDPEARSETLEQLDAAKLDDAADDSEARGLADSAAMHLRKLARSSRGAVRRLLSQRSELLLKTVDCLYLIGDREETLKQLEQIVKSRPKLLKEIRAAWPNPVDDGITLEICTRNDRRFLDHFLEDLDR